MLKEVLLTVTLLDAPEGVPCQFESHVVQPPRPSPQEEFSVTFFGQRSCLAFLDTSVIGSVVTIQVDCDCVIGVPPSPTPFEETVEIPGLPPGGATIEVHDVAPFGGLVYQAEVLIGSVIDVPTLGRKSLLVLAVSLFVLGILLVRSRRRKLVA